VGSRPVLIEAAMYRRFLEGYKFLLDKLEWAEMGLCMILLAVVVAMYAIEIFTRYFLKYSSPINAEIGLLLINWMYFLGFAVLFHRGEDVVMEYFFKLLPKGMRQLLDWLTHLAILLFLVILFKECIGLRALTNLMDHQVLPVKQSFVNLPLLVGTLLTLLISTYFILIKTEQLIRWWIRKEESRSTIQRG
jgi:TRAP-type C4-dicarboxylate transport system permease small subunit